MSETENTIPFLQACPSLRNCAKFYADSVWSIAPFIYCNDECTVLFQSRVQGKTFEDIVIFLKNRGVTGVINMLSSYQQEDRRNHELLYNKWMGPIKSRRGSNILDFSKHKERVIIWTGPAWEPWNRQKVDDGMAGSETWAAYLAREFVRRGYETRIYNDLLSESKDDTVLDPVIGPDGKDYGSVIYRDHTKLMEDIQYLYIEHFICSRSADPFHQSLHSGRHYVMVHDIWISGDRNYDIMGWKVQGYAYLSEWHKNFLQQHHKMPPDKMFQTANGVVQDLYVGVDEHTKKNQMVYSSSPDRGLYQLLQMLPDIRKGCPDFQILVAYGFFNWESAAKARNDTASMQLIQKIKGLMNQPGVVYLDRINKEQLAKHQKESKVWFFPTWFTETFCCIPTNEIYTHRGYKPICNLTLEDKVLTHSGHFRNVHKLMKRPYKGTVCGFSCKNNSGAISYFTPEHQILGLRAKAAREVSRQKYGDYKAVVLDQQPEWINSGEIKVGDYLCFPSLHLDDLGRSYDLLPDYKKINRLYRVIKGRIKTRDYDKHLGVPSKIIFTEDFARFLGFYFSEGSFDYSVVKFSFHKKEVEYHNFIMGFVREILELPASIVYPDGENSAIVTINSYTLGIWLKQQFGHSASFKTVPGFVQDQGKEFCKAFIKAAFDGDGNYSAKHNRIQLASKIGLMNLRMLMFSVGMYPSLLKPNVSGKSNNKYYTLSVAKGQWERCYTGAFSGKEQKTYIEHKGLVFFKVKEVLIKPYEGYVYNMEVAEDNSYVSDYIAAHNCIGAVENGLSKNALLTTRLAGLITTIGDAGQMLSPAGLSRDGAYPKEFREAFIEKSIKLLTDEGHRQEWAQKAYEKVQEYRWENIVEGWMQQFLG